MPSIWRIHPQLKNKNPDDYEPKVVSIGPLHHGKEGLIPMEKTKLEILNYILHGQPHNTLDILFDEVFQCIGEARKEYSEMIELSDEEFAKLIVVDTCFVIVLFSFGRDSGDALWSAMITKSVTKSVSYITYSNIDIWLLENQIPFLVVNKVFQKLCVVNPKLEEAFPNCMSLFISGMQGYLPQEKYPMEEEVRHLLHMVTLIDRPDVFPRESCEQSYWRNVTIRTMRKLIHLISLPFWDLFYLVSFRDYSGPFRPPTATTKLKVIPTATKLRETGMNFRVKAMPEGYHNVGRCNISFGDGTLEIPKLSFGHSTFVLLRNLIAFEQCTFSHFSSHYTCYCFLLDQLINTPEDVRVLQHSGILDNNLGSEYELAEMVNGLCKEASFPPMEDPYVELREDVQKFCQVPHHQWRASLLQNYFHSPWAQLSVIAAIILVVVIITQTSVGLRQPLSRLDFLDDFQLVL